MSKIETYDLSIEQIFDFLAEKKYYSSAFFKSKNVEKFTALNNTPLGINFPVCQTLVFKYPANTDKIVSLAQSYFTISGEFKTIGNDIDLTLNDYEGIIIKFGENWIFNAFDSVALRIGGAEIYKYEFPMNYSMFQKIHYKDMRDINAGCNDIYGYPKQNTSIDGTLDDEFNCYSTNISNISFDETTKTIRYNYILRLCDLFPGIETIKGIWAQDCEVIIKLSTDGYINARVLKSVYKDDKEQDVNTGITDILIKNFKQFNINFISATLNDKLIDYFEKYYSTESINVYDTLTYSNNGMVNYSTGTTISIPVKLNMNYRTDFISLSFPQSVNNLYVQELPTDLTKIHFNNFNIHLPNDLRFMNVQHLTIKTNSNITLFDQDYADWKIPTDSENKNPALYQLGYTFGNHPPINNFITTYDNYLECRYCTQQTEEGSLNYNDFLLSSFCFDIPLSCFDRISSDKEIIVNITFGDGIYHNGSTTYPVMNQIKKEDVMVLNQLRVIQKYKKALIIKGKNNCVVKDIEQDFKFENDISTEPEIKH